MTYARASVYYIIRLMMIVQKDTIMFNAFKNHNENVGNHKQRK